MWRKGSRKEAGKEIKGKGADKRERRGKENIIKGDVRKSGEKRSRKGTGKEIKGKEDKREREENIANGDVRKSGKKRK